MKQVWVKRATWALDGVDDRRGGVAHADHGDARAEVDQGVAVDVDEDRPGRRGRRRAGRPS